MPQNWTGKCPVPQIQSMDNISEPASRLLEECTEKVFYFNNQTKYIFTYPEKSLETHGLHFVLCTPLFCKVIEIYFKNCSILKIVIFIHSMWNNKIFLQQIRENHMHDKLSLKMVVALLHTTHKNADIYMDHIIHKIEILKCIFPFCTNASHTGCGVWCTPDTEWLLTELHDVNNRKLHINRVYQQ